MTIFKAVNLWDSIPAELYDGNTYSWYNFINNVTKDVDNRISQADDLTGNGRHLIQSTDDSKPLWSLEGATFDGLNDYLRATGWNLTKPTTLYVVMKRTSVLSNIIIMDGLVANELHFSTYAPTRLLTRSGVNSIVTSEGAFISNVTSVFCLKYDGVNSFIRFGATKTTGTTGSITATGLTLAATADLNTFSPMIFKELIIRSVSDSAETENVIMDSLISRY